MGFLNKKPIIKTEGFHPIDLNEGNVQAIFNRCLATKDSVDFIGATLFTKETGFSENSKQIVFDKFPISFCVPRFNIFSCVFPPPAGCGNTQKNWALIKKRF